jgi:hypothetical protein
MVGIRAEQRENGWLFNEYRVPVIPGEGVMKMGGNYDYATV